MISLDRLQSLLSYDPATGEWTWLVSRGRVSAGQKAGAESKGYLVVGIDGRLYKAHVMAWFYMTGEWPSGDVDHSDVDPLNNRWVNLRPATRSQNCGNIPPHHDNTSGFKGVAWHKQRGKWRAQGCVNGKTKHLGLFVSKEKARAAYAEWAASAFGEFARAA